LSLTPFGKEQGGGTKVGCSDGRVKRT